MDKLAIFWRDRFDRCFTWFHFLVAENESSLERARRLLAAISSLSRLQVYGGVLNYTPFPVDLENPPPLSGVRERLEMSLFPDAPLQPKLGIALLKFSIPGPVEEMRAMGEAGRPDEESPLWDFFKLKVVPYLSLPRGIGVLRGSSFVQKIEIRQIQPGASLPPVDAAISANEEHLRRAEGHLAKCYEIGRDPTAREIRSVEKYRERLAWLHALQEIEVSLYEQAAALDPPLEKPVPKHKAPRPSTRVKPKPIESRPVESRPVESRPIAKPSRRQKRERLLPLFDRLEESFSVGSIEPTPPSHLSTQPPQDAYTQAISALQKLYQQNQSEAPKRYSRGRCSAKKAAERLGVSTATVRRWCRDKKLAANKFAGVWLISVASVRSLQRKRANSRLG